MLTTVDIIRLIMHTLKCISKNEPVGKKHHILVFTNFVAKREEEVGHVDK